MIKHTPMKAIRRKCLDCCCYNPVEVKLCELRTCPLYPYKDGHKPKEGTEEYKTLIDGTFDLDNARRAAVNAKESI